MPPAAANLNCADRKQALTLPRNMGTSYISALLIPKSQFVLLLLMKYVYKYMF